MIDDGRALSAAEAGQLAALHRTVLRESVLGRMDPTTLERYYRWVSRSVTEHLFLAREGNDVIGAAVLSVRPDSVIGRFVRAAPAAFAVSAAKTFLRDSAFRRELRAFVFERDRAATSGLPEVLQIFVAPERRAHQVGTGLLLRVEKWLEARTLPRYCVRTLADGNEATIAFYARRGFQPAGERIFCGARYQVLEKVVA